jgi:branched-chain amino acid transport system substrate-binding protein
MTVAAGRGADPCPGVEAFNTAFKATTGARPASQYVDPGYVLINLWAKAVARPGRVEGAGVTAALAKMRDKPTAFGSRSFSETLHHQDTALLQIIEITSDKPDRVDEWQITKPVPLDVLMGK